MSSPTNKTSDRRAQERRSEPSLPIKGKGERRVVEAQPEPAVATAMIDALEDILKWERASERALRIAAVSEPPADGAVSAVSN